MRDVGAIRPGRTRFSATDDYFGGNEHHVYAYRYKHCWMRL
jgi:hypothetical protein